QLGIGTFAIYVMDFGAAVGFRLALRHPERLSAIIVQNAPLYLWEPRAGGPPWASTGRTGPPGTATPRALTWTETGCAASTCPASRTPRGSTRTTGSSTRR